MSHVALTRSQASSFVERVEAWLAGWRRFRGKSRRRRKSSASSAASTSTCYAIWGSRWTGRRFERMGRDEAVER